MKIMFRINDGKVIRFCTYEDLFIIIEFDLEFIIYSKKKKWLFFKQLENNNLLYMVYASLKTLRQINSIYPVTAGGISFINNKIIDIVECKELYKYKQMALVKMLIEME